MAKSVQPDTFVSHRWVPGRQLEELLPAIVWPDLRGPASKLRTVSLAGTGVAAASAVSAAVLGWRRYGRAGTRCWMTRETRAGWSNPTRVSVTGGWVGSHFHKSRNETRCKWREGLEP